MGRCQGEYIIKLHLVEFSLKFFIVRMSVSCLNGSIFDQKQPLGRGLIQTPAW